MGRFFESLRELPSLGSRELAAWGCRFDRRRWWPHVLRMLVLLACAGVLLTNGWWQSATAPGIMLLQIVATIQFLGLALAATQFASAMAPLTDPGFMPLCALTGLRPVEILVARMAHRWVIGWSLWILPLPLLAFASTSGGVRGIHIAALLAWSAIAFVLLTGMAALSCITPPQPAGVAAPPKQVTLWGFEALGMVLFYHGAFLLFVAGLNLINHYLCGDRQLWLKQAANWLQNALPVQQIATALGPSFAGPIVNAEMVLHGVVGLAAWCLALTALQQRMFPEKGDPLSPDPQMLPTIWTEKRRPPRLAGDPFYWKDANFLLPLGGVANTRTAWITSVLLCLLVLAVDQWYGGTFIAEQIPVFTAVLFVGSLLASFAALMHTEFREKTWASLALMPTPRAVMLRAKFRAMARVAARTSLPMLTAGALAVARHPEFLVPSLVGGTAATLVLTCLFAYLIALPETAENYFLGTVIFVAVLIVIGACVAAWVLLGNLFGGIITVLATAGSVWLLWNATVAALEERGDE